MKKLFPILRRGRVYGTKRIGQRVRSKSTKHSDFERTNAKPHHTDPVKHFVSDAIDTTGARDPSRMRHAQTKARREFEQAVDACNV